MKIYHIDGKQKNIQINLNIEKMSKGELGKCACTCAQALKMHIYALGRVCDQMVKVLDSLSRGCVFRDSVQKATLTTYPQSSFFFLLSDHMAPAGYVCVAITHRTLTWTIGSLTCAQMSIHATAHGGVRTPKQSLH